jgi:hypothetical protein
MEGNGIGGLLQEGQAYVLHVVPGWILQGIVTRVQDEALVIHEGAYLELIAGPEAAAPQLCEARTAEEARAVYRRAWPLPEGSVIYLGAISQAWPARMSGKWASETENS